MLRKRKYFETLGLAPGATKQQIRKRYRKLVVKVHPDKNKAPDAKERFQNLQTAYEALNSDSGTERSFSAFEQKFSKHATFNTAFGLFGFNNAFRFTTSSGASWSTGPTPRRPTACPQKNREINVRHVLECSLEELAKGARRTLRVTVSYWLSPVKSRPLRNTVVVNIESGSRAGDEFRFRGKGSKTSSGPRGDLLVVLAQKPHKKFVCAGHALRHRVVLPKRLKSGERYTLDLVGVMGERIKKTFDGPILHGDQAIVRGHGMPMKGPGPRGDLLVLFGVAGK